MWKLALVFATACTHAATCPPPAAPVAVVADDDVPPPDEQLKKWQAIHAAKDRVPDGMTAGALLPELVAYLGSVDPVRRDGIGYEVLVGWILRDPKLSPEELKGLTKQLTANLAGPLDAKDGVYLRSFSALVLSVLVKRDTGKDPFLDPAERTRLLDAAVAYAGRETDLRGHTGKRGWAHAAGHTSDLLKFLAREASFTDDDRMRILDATLELAVRKHGANFHHGEDGRIATAVIEALRGGVPDDKIEPWVKKLIAPLEVEETPQFDPVMYAAQRNARNLVFTLIVQLSSDPKISDDGKTALQTIRRLVGA